MRTHPQDELTELRRALGADAALLERLSAGQRERLAGVMADARTRQHDRLIDALNGALAFIPAPLRGAVHKLFLHGSR